MVEYILRRYLAPVEEALGKGKVAALRANDDIGEVLTVLIIKGGLLIHNNMSKSNVGFHRWQHVQNHTWPFQVYKLYNEELSRQDDNFTVVLWRRAGNEVHQVAGNVAGNVKRIVMALGGETLSRSVIMQRLRLKGSGHFRDTYLYPAIEDGFIDKLYPDADKRPDQAYYLTTKGLELPSELKRKPTIANDNY